MLYVHAKRIDLLCCRVSLCRPNSAGRLPWVYYLRTVRLFCLIFWLLVYCMQVDNRPTCFSYYSVSFSLVFSRLLSCLLYCPFIIRPIWCAIDLNFYMRLDNWQCSSVLSYDWTARRQPRVLLLSAGASAHIKAFIYWWIASKVSSVRA